MNTGPLRVSRICEDPAAVVLGLDDENPEPGNENVVDLRGSVIHALGDVIHQVVVGCAEVREHYPRDQLLAAVVQGGRPPRPD